MDMKRDFPSGDLEEKVYMYQLQGFQVTRKEHMVCKLKKALYALKQAPRAWYIKFDRHFGEWRFKRSPSNPNIYIKSKKGDTMITSSEVGVIEKENKIYVIFLT